MWPSQIGPAGLKKRGPLQQVSNAKNGVCVCARAPPNKICSVPRPINNSFIRGHIHEFCWSALYYILIASTVRSRVVAEHARSAASSALVMK